MTRLSKRKARIKEQERNVWSDSAHLEQKKRGPYLTGKTKKSTYFDKYGLSGSFTKAAKGTANILTLINKHKSIPADFDEVLDDMEIDELNYMSLNLKERIENLKVELKEKQKSLTVTEYNKKRAIFEYLRRLDDNENGKVKASIEAAKLSSRQTSKIVHLIDDEDIAEKCHTWIRSQGGTTTPLKFKEFVEEKLLVNSGILKKKTIDIATAARWFNVLGYFFQSHKQGKNELIIKKK
ncbi:13064_t:CDS:2 [Funneliformis geosporum]|nr:13064_t:CDS:2 [Funneliformis geosporum]